MIKEDFKFGNEKYFIEDKYVFDSKEYIIVINKDVFDSDSVEYANKIAKNMRKKKIKSLIIQ